ncbi:MAG: hypothetical protein HY855_06430 [Burkholderiales bacterium]|nr:hypothetical protein [Burkholderiales bacterium]
MSSAVATAPGSATGRRSQIESFFRTLILGDFEDHPNTPAEIIGGLISLVPVLDQVMDVRDIAACLYKINNQGGFKHATPEQVVNLGFAAIGAIPEVGSAFKTVFKPLWRERHLAKTAVNSGVHAVEALLGMRKGGAIDWIRKELIGKWGARTSQAIQRVNAALDACIALLEFVATAQGWKGWLIPDSIQTLAHGMLPGMKAMRTDVNSTMQRASAEIGIFLQDLLGEQAAAVVMAAGQKAVAASALPGARSNAKNQHNAAAVHPKGQELPRQGRKKTLDKDTTNTEKGAGGSHRAIQATRQAFGKMSHVATGLIGEHMVDYHELKRLGGTFIHDSNKPFASKSAVAKINADKRPVNLSLEDLPKVPHKGIDAIWAHNGKLTVTEAKARGSIFAVESMMSKLKTPAGIASHGDKMLFHLLSTSKDAEGDGKTVIQMSRRWVQMRADAEGVPADAKLALANDACERRVVLVTFESPGATDHAQALAELNLGCPRELIHPHPEHETQFAWDRSAIDRVVNEKYLAASTKAASKDNSQVHGSGEAGKKSGSKKRR